MIENPSKIPTVPGETVCLVGFDKDQNSDIWSGLNCEKYTIFPIALENLSDTIDRDINRRISCVVMSSDLDIDAVKEQLARRPVNQRQYHPPQVILLEEVHRRFEPDFLESGADRVIPHDANDAAKRLIVQSIISEYRGLISLTAELGWRKSAIGQIEQGTFRYFTRQEARNLATMLSLTCPDPLPVAIGLTELFVNAVEHGCLGLKAGEKEDLIAKGKLEQVLAIRRALPENDHKSVLVSFESSPLERRFTICDPGEGFNHAKMLDREFEEAGMAKSGRGVLMAQACFTELVYKGNGNIVEARVALSHPLQRTKI